MIHKFIKQAIEEANKSEHQHKVGAIIFDKSRIISKGFNHPQRHVRHLKRKFQRWPGTVHAEVDAIIKAKTNLRNLSMLIVRINKKNQLRLSKPCKWCQMYLEYVGIKKIYYSINEFPYIKEEQL
jgi:deoxycytidylate deaminase